jgi:hypothetical protein
MDTIGVDEGYTVVECEWRLGRVGQHALLLTLKNPQETNLHYYFDEENGELLLWQYAADPDAWRYVEFRKTHSE